MATDDLTREAERIRAARPFGRSGPLRRLFDYLVEAAAADVGRSEIDIAAAVFGKPDDVDLSQDATVRVYVHRLRAKLAAFYDGQAERSPIRLTIPRGQYRLVVEAIVTPAVAVTAPLRNRWRLAAFAATLLAVNLGAWAVLWPRDSGDLATVRQSSLWAPLIADTRPITIVVGDYYIFGEIDQQRNTDRLVREYRINSPRQLDDYIMAHPDRLGRYHDLGLSYLPTGVAAALRDIMPVLVRSDHDRRRVRIVVSSELSPVTLRNTDIVYVGYLSALALLRDPVFAGSHLTPGATWDDLVDRTTGQRFISNEGGAEHIGARTRGFGYLAQFIGPTGNQIIVIAGTRDMALTGVAEAATHASSLSTVGRSLPHAANREALLQVDGIDRQLFAEQMLNARPRLTHVWDAKANGGSYPEG